MHRYYPTIVAVATIMHLVWAVGLMADPLAHTATPIHTLIEFLSLVLTSDDVDIYAAVVFVSVAFLAICGLIKSNPLIRGGLILPQHLVLWVSAGGAVYAMWTGQYADGVIRSHWFIIVDQIPILLITLGHSAALLFILDKGKREATEERGDDGG